MSPASSGPLEVERYIGACLISSHTRSKNSTSNIYPHGGYMSYRCNSVDGWAGGMPLISFANNQRRARRPETSESPREDAPLSRLAVHTQGLPLILAGRNTNRRTKPTRNIPQRVDPKKTVDTISVASDESTNSETSLPRIIKPRKRRKKDRKPHPVRSQEDSASSSIVTLKPYVPYFYERYTKVEDSKKILDETPQLHHKFEDVADADDNEPSSCQCRYCDPAQIWDVDRHCYSPFLTSPPFRQLHHSVSDPTGDSSFFKQYYLSERISSALKNQCLISSLEEKLPNRTQQCLEISTKIVTSPNGHRDLEIRLFSTFPIDDRPEKDNKTCAENTSEQNLTPEE